MTQSLNSIFNTTSRELSSYTYEPLAVNDIDKVADVIQMAKKGKINAIVSELGVVKGKNEIITTNTLEKNDISNSRFGESGYQVLIDTLTAYNQEVIEQEILKETDQLVNAVETTVGFAPFAETYKHRIGGKVAGLPSQHRMAINHNGEIRKTERQITTFESKREMFGYLTSYHKLVEMQQEALQLRGLEYSRTLRDLGEVIATHQNIIRAFGHEVSAGTFEGGLFNFKKNNESNSPNISAISKPMSQMTEAELETAIENMLKAYYTQQKNIEHPDTLVLPDFDTGEANYKRVENLYSIAFFNELIEKKIRARTNGKPVNIIYSKYADKVVNAQFGINGGQGRTFYMLMNKEKSKAFFDLPIPFTVVTQPQEIGLEVQSIGISQVGNVIVPLPEFAIVFNPTNE
jgi:hypothetical protein